MLNEVIEKRTASDGIKEYLLSEYEIHSGVTLNGRNRTIQGIRQKAIETFDRLGIPGRKNEAWKYTNITSALRPHYTVHLPVVTGTVTRAEVEALKIPGLDAHLIVVENGRFSEALSTPGDLPEGVIIESLETASEKYSDAFEQHFARYADFQKEPFVALNTAFTHDGVFIQVAPGTTLDKPIHIITVTKTPEKAFLQPRNLFVFGRSSSAKVIQSFHNLSEGKTLLNGVTEAYVGQNAKAEMYVLELEHEDGSMINTHHVHQERDSNFTVATITMGGSLVRNNLTIVPDGENCESHLFGLYLLDGTQHVDNHTLVDHAKPHCFSNELYKGVLDGRSTGVFNGKVFVRRDSQKTNAFQENKSIVLTDEANMYAKPELEIYADDVKCSHGATTGSVDPEALFYLRSRGISEVDARTMLLYAFALDVVENIAIEPLREMLDDLIATRFNR